MTTFADWIKAIDSFVWGPAMLALILGTGFYLQLRLGGMPIRKIGAGLRLVWGSRGGDAAHGEVSPYSALMTRWPRRSAWATSQASRPRLRSAAPAPCSGCG